MAQLLEEMQEMWGSRFQKLDHSERLWMILEIAKNMCEADYCDESEPIIFNQMECVFERLDELNTRDKLNLIQCLVNQVISQG